MEIEIKIAKQTDTPSVHKYYTTLLEENISYISDNPAPSLEEEEIFVRGFVKGPGELLLAFDGAEAVGMLAIQRSSHYQENHRIHIGISVKKEYRGKGLGKQLLKSAEAWAKKNFVLSIELEVIATNPAINLYKKLGYKEIGRVKNGFKVNEEFLDVISMQYTL